MNDRYTPDFTMILNRLVDGSNHLEERDELWNAVFKELQIMAAGFMKNEREDHTLQPTALVNEVYLRLIKVDMVDIRGRSHFFGIAARAMRQVLIDHARQKKSQKRGGDWKRLTLSSIENIGSEKGIDLLDLDRALIKLEDLDPRGAAVAMMRIFGRMKMIEIAEELNVTRRTVQSDWQMASMWLSNELSGSEFS